MSINLTLGANLRSTAPSTPFREIHMPYGPGRYAVVIVYPSTPFREIQVAGREKSSTIESRYLLLLPLGRFTANSMAMSIRTFTH